MRSWIAMLLLIGCSDRPLHVPEEIRPVACGEDVVTCADSPQGRVVSTSGRGDCFADDTEGALWPAADRSVVLCGEITRVFGEGGTLARPCGDFDQRLQTPGCTMTGIRLGQRLAWDFTCVVDGKTCQTALVFADYVR